MCTESGNRHVLHELPEMLAPEVALPLFTQACLSQRILKDPWRWAGPLALWQGGKRTGKQAPSKNTVSSRTAWRKPFPNRGRQCLSHGIKMLSAVKGAGSSAMGCSSRERKLNGELQPPASTSPVDSCCMLRGPGLTPWSLSLFVLFHGSLTWRDTLLCPRPSLSGSPALTLPQLAAAGCLEHLIGRCFVIYLSTYLSLAIYSFSLACYVFNKSTCLKPKVQLS